MVCLIERERLEELLIREEKYYMILDILKGYDSLNSAQFDMLKRLFVGVIPTKEIKQVEPVESVEAIEPKKTKAKK